MRSFKDVLGDRSLEGDGDRLQRGGDKRQVSRAGLVGRVQVPWARRVAARSIAAPHGGASLVQTFDGGLVDGAKDVVDEGLDGGVPRGILVVDGRHKWRSYPSHGDRAGVGRPWRAVGGQRGGQLAFKVQVMAFASQVRNAAVGDDVAYSALVDPGAETGLER